MPSEKQGAPVWIWLVVLLPLGLVLLAVASSVAIYGVRQYLRQAKAEEARATLVTWGDGLANCGQQPGGLPPSATPVPPSLSDVAARKFQSEPADWKQAAHTCAGFSLTSPQHFQYSWERTTHATGVIHALADLDGNGEADVGVDLDVTCAGRSCTRGTPIRVDQASRGAANPASQRRASDGGSPEVGPLFGAFVAVCLLGALVGHVWFLLVAFQVSTSWGFLAMCVPCANLVFAYQYWPRAKRAFALWLGSGVTLQVGVFTWGMTSAAASDYRQASDDGAAASSAEPRKPPAPWASSQGVRLAPLPSAGPLLPLQGEPADLSSVMGRARKLANQWQREAALLGVEASTLIGAQIQTRDGGSAKLTFGPGAFDVSQPRGGLFVVTYDESGLKGVAAKGDATPALPEPMCAPEFIYQRLAGAGQRPVIALRYALDRRRGTAVWFGQLTADAEGKSTAFDRDTCHALPEPARH